MNTEPDPWRMKEWHALEDVCFIKGCEYYDIDHRGPIFLTDGSIHKACEAHWTAIISILGDQANLDDAMHWISD